MEAADGNRWERTGINNAENDSDYGQMGQAGAPPSQPRQTSHARGRWFEPSRAHHERTVDHRRFIEDRLAGQALPRTTLPDKLGRWGPGRAFCAVLLLGWL